MRKEVYPALYQVGEEGPERLFACETVMKAPEAAALWAQRPDAADITLAGDGLKKYRTLYEEAGFTRFAPDEAWYPTGEGLLRANAASQVPQHSGDPGPRVARLHALVGRRGERAHPPGPPRAADHASDRRRRRPGRRPPAAAPHERERRGRRGRPGGRGVLRGPPRAVDRAGLLRRLHYAGPHLVGWPTTRAISWATPEAPSSRASYRSPTWPWSPSAAAKASRPGCWSASPTTPRCSAAPPRCSRWRWATTRPSPSTAAWALPRPAGARATTARATTPSS